MCRMYLPWNTPCGLRIMGYSNTIVYCCLSWLCFVSVVALLEIGWEGLLWGVKAVPRSFTHKKFRFLKEICFSKIWTSLGTKIHILVKDYELNKCCTYQVQIIG